MSADDTPVPVLGGLGEVKEMTDECREVLTKVRDGCEEKAGKKFELFEPVHFRTQMVNGMNYFIKVKVADDDFIHVRAHKSFQDDTISLWGIQQGKKLECTLEHFD